MDDIEKELKVFADEVHVASVAFFTWKCINNIAAGDKKIFRALNSNALSWKIIQHSLQTTFLITLGRIFDTDSRSYSVQSLIDYCIVNIDQFSKEALRERKLGDSDGGKWIDGYVEKSYQPKEDDFIGLKDWLSGYEETYTDVYKPIRNKLMAHMDRDTFESKDDLFEKTNIGQIEDMLCFLFQISEVI